MHHGAERKIAEFRRSAVIPDDPIRQHGEGVRIISVELAIPLHTDAATPVGMIHEHKFAPVGVRLFQRREFSRLGSEGLVGEVEGSAEEEQRKSEAERR